MLTQVNKVNAIVDHLKPFLSEIDNFGPIYTSLESGGCMRVLTRWQYQHISVVRIQRF